MGGAPGVPAHNCRNQAITLRTPVVREIGPCNTVLQNEKIDHHPCLICHFSNNRRPRYGSGVKYFGIMRIFMSAYVRHRLQMMWKSG
jgi:hypothetical protein